MSDQPSKDPAGEFTRLLGGLLAGVVAGVVASAEQRETGDDAGAVAPPPTGQTTPKSRPGRVKQLPQWNVILLDDDDHTYAYVIDMLGTIFGHPMRSAEKMAHEVDEGGRVIVFTTHRELAELKCDQIRKFGLDPRISTCRGSMSAFIEPAS